MTYCFRPLVVAALIVGCGAISSCGPKTTVAMQQTVPAVDPEVSRKAEELFQVAGDALNNQQYDLVESKIKEVVQLLPDHFRVQQRAGEMLFLSGKVKESLPHFDKAIELIPQQGPMNWQRGIALAVAGDFKAGAEQFKSHHDVNRDDVENTAWYHLCLAKSEGLEAANKAIIPSRGDKRPPMMSILKMLRGEIAPEQVLADAEKVGPSPEQKALAQFYGDLYVGLYFDAIGRSQEAEKYLKRSLEYDRDHDYMYQSSRLYLERQVQKSGSSDHNAKQ